MARIYSPCGKSDFSSASDSDIGFSPLRLLLVLAMLAILGWWALDSGVSAVAA